MQLAPARVFASFAPWCCCFLLACSGQVGSHPVDAAVADRLPAQSDASRSDRPQTDVVGSDRAPATDLPIPIDRVIAPDAAADLLLADVIVQPDRPPPPPPPTVATVYVSGYSPQIARFQLDLQSGMLTPQEVVDAPGAPSFLAVNPARTQLYAIDENGATASAFSIDPQSGALSFQNTVDSGGQGPAHVGVDGSGQWVFAAHYTDGTISVLPVQADGSLADVQQHLTAGANAHQMLADRSNQFVFVPCLGANKIVELTFDAQGGMVTPNSPGSIASASGSGPRHLALHPGQPWVYAIHEKNSTIAPYTLDGSGQLALIEPPTSTLPSGFSGSNTGAEVAVHPSGKFVYGSNRGDDSIAIFAVDPSSGGLSAAGHASVQGQTPRSFALDPTGQYLLVANQGSDNVVVFTVDAQSGALTPTGQTESAPNPSFVGIVFLPE